MQDFRQDLCYAMQDFRQDFVRIVQDFRQDFVSSLRAYFKKKMKEANIVNDKVNSRLSKKTY